MKATGLPVSVKTRLGWHRPDELLSFVKGLESAGSVTADVSGTSFLPALVVPIPLIARARAAACKGLAEQLRTFIVDEPQA